MASDPTETNIPLLTIDHVAERLCCSTKSVRRLVAAGDLPVIRIGRMVRVHPSDLERFVRVHREG